MAKIVVRLPEPRREYTEDNQRQINRAISSVIEQLNSTYQQPQKDKELLVPQDPMLICIQRQMKQPLLLNLLNYIILTAVI